MDSQNVSLPTDLMGYVSELVGAGEYDSVNDVYREAIQDLQSKKERERLNRAHVNQLLEVGERDLKEGRYTVMETEEEQRAFFSKLEQDLIREHA